jgi:hypothetical protein
MKKLFLLAVVLTIMVSSIISFGSSYKRINVDGTRNTGYIFVDIDTADSLDDPLGPKAAYCETTYSELVQIGTGTIWADYTKFAILVRLLTLDTGHIEMSDATNDSIIVKLVTYMTDGGGRCVVRDMDTITADNDSAYVPTINRDSLLEYLGVMCIYKDTIALEGMDTNRYNMMVEIYGR